MAVAPRYTKADGYELVDHWLIKIHPDVAPVVEADDADLLRNPQRLYSVMIVS